MVKKFQNLYVLDVDKLPTGPTSGSVTAQVNLIPIQTWHNRLGYLSSKVLDVLRPQLQCDTSKCKFQEPCYVCPWLNSEDYHLFVIMLCLQHHLT